MRIANKPLNSVTIVGTGLIGLGWCVVFAKAGLEVHAYDADATQLDRLRGRLANAADLLHRVGWLSQNDIPALIGRVTYFTDLDDALAGVGYVQESVPEDPKRKKAIFEEIDRRSPADVVIGSSTSGIPMTAIAERTRHPERCVVVHPTNPPHMVPLVEIVPGKRTSQATVDFARSLMEAVGQSPIVCRKEVPGFVLNRLQFALEREAFYLARQGVASVADIDRAVSEGLGLRWALMGPFMVEETNADNIRDDLTKFGPAIQKLMETVCRPFDGISPEDVDGAEIGVHELMASRTHDDLLAFRDELVLRIRALKSTWHADTH
jgi:L-gulonate 3-dehydrogenase